MGIIWLLLLVAFLAGLWKVFEKAGRQGWEGIVPLYNGFVLITGILRKPWWMFLLVFVPVVNFILGIYLSIKLADCFGKGVGFKVGLILLPFIFLPILGFGDAQYTPPESEA